LTARLARLLHWPMHFVPGFAAPLALACLLTVACGDETPRRQAPAGPTPDSFDVAFRTNEGTFVVRAVRRWAPLGTDRFYQLAGQGFFDDNRFYRVLPGYIAQFGASDDLKRNKYWEARPLQDDPPREKNRRGTVSFAFLNANGRTHQLFVNLKDNPGLDADGFVPIGRVVEGMAVVDSLYDEYGNDPKYQLLATQGNRYLARMFPKLDYIESATIVAPAAPSSTP
jgi:cyclophilin family peptidyl-prolyl cis-trans isomerase